MSSVVFGFSDDLTLMVFSDSNKAKSYAEGIDVAAGVWKFFDHQGRALHPKFVVPNCVRGLSIESGQYNLTAGDGPELLEFLPKVASVEGYPPFETVAQIEKMVYGPGIR